MQKRSTWIAAVLALISIGLIMACNTKYSSSSTSNGLVVVPTLANQVMQTFSINLSNGSVSQINNAGGPPIPGYPSSVLIDPAGAYAYVASTVNCTGSGTESVVVDGVQQTYSYTLSAVQGAIVAYPIASNGKLSPTAGPQYLTGNPAYPTTFQVSGTSDPVATCGLDDSTNPNPGNPVAAMAIDSAGKFLFVATASAGATYTLDLPTPATITPSLNSVGVAVFAIGANGTLTQVPGSPFALPAEPGGQAPSASALAVTPTVYPIQYSACSSNAPLTTENLYVTDSVNYVVVNFSVNPSTGFLTLVPTASTPAIATGTVPTGVAVDPCNRFVFVSNSTSNNVSAYTICSAVSVAQNCQTPDFSLQAVTGSPYPAGDFPGPIAVDAFGKFLYVVDTGSNQISGFQIGASNGTLSTIPSAALNQGPNSIAIRSDDSYLFVANSTSANLSEYAITPASGALVPQNTSGIQTFNTPTGVAVK